MFAPLEFAIDFNAQTPSVEMHALPNLIACRGPMNDPRCININAVFQGVGDQIGFRLTATVCLVYVCLP